MTFAGATRLLPYLCTTSASMKNRDFLILRYYLSSSRVACKRCARARARGAVGLQPRTAEVLFCSPLTYRLLHTLCLPLFSSPVRADRLVAPCGDMSVNAPHAAATYHSSLALYHLVLWADRQHATVLLTRAVCHRGGWARLDAVWCA